MYILYFSRYHRQRGKASD